MNPIINPIFFYFISVTGVLRNIVLIGGFAIVGCIVFAGFICCIDVDIEEVFNAFKKPVIIFLLIGTLGVFIPSENTCYKMLAASLITPDNIEVMKDGTQELVNYIIDVADQITDDDDDDKDK